MGKSEISLSELGKFRVNVGESFEENKISSIFLFSENYVLDMVHNYSDCFELNADGEILKLKVGPASLVAKFIAYLSNDIIKAVYSTKETV